MTSPSQAPNPAEIANLLAWARQLSNAGATADPAQRAAYLAAKANLLARVADTHAHDHTCHASRARQVADQARDLAAQANTIHQPKDTR